MIPLLDQQLFFPALAKLHQRVKPKHVDVDALLSPQGGGELAKHVRTALGFKDMQMLIEPDMGMALDCSVTPEIGIAKSQCPT